MGLFTCAFLAALLSFTTAEAGPFSGEWRSIPATLTPIGAPATNGMTIRDGTTAAAPYRVAVGFPCSAGVCATAMSDARFSFGGPFTSGYFFVTALSAPAPGPVFVFGQRRECGSGLLGIWADERGAVRAAECFARGVTYRLPKNSYAPDVRKPLQLPPAITIPRVPH